MGKIKDTESLIRNFSAFNSFKLKENLKTDYSIAKFFDGNEDKVDADLYLTVSEPRTWNRLSKGAFKNQSFDGRVNTRWADLSSAIGEKPNQIYEHGPYDWWTALFGDKNHLEDLVYHHQSTVKCFLDSDDQQINLRRASQPDLKSCERFFIEYVDHNLSELENEESVAYIFGKLIAIYRLHHWFTSSRFPPLNSSYITLYNLANCQFVKRELEKYQVFDLALKQLKKLETDRLSNHHHIKHYGKKLGWSQFDIQEDYLTNPSLINWTKLISLPIENKAYFIKDIKLADQIIPTCVIDELIHNTATKVCEINESMRRQKQLQTILNNPNALFIDLLKLANKQDEWKDIYSPDPLFKPYREFNWSRDGENGLDKYFEFN